MFLGFKAKSASVLQIAQMQFFKKNISRKHGQKWCPWGQNGKPLRQETVAEYIDSFGKEKITGKVSVVWKPNEDYTRLSAVFYVENVFKCVKFIKDLYNLDSETMRQIPGVQIKDQDIFEIGKIYILTFRTIHSKAERTKL